MNRSNRGLSCRAAAFLTLLAFAAGIAAGVFGWIWIAGGSGEPSRPAEEAAAALDADDALEASDAESRIIEFQIVPAKSQATFTLEEDLRGVRTTVVGSTREVGGTIIVNLDNPPASSIGTIVVNARNLETDNSFRNRALRSSILKSAQDDYEFITFEPRSLDNFSAESVSIGDTLTFDITGSLNIADVTRTLTFNAAVTLESETQISGSATANVLHADYSLVIPEVPSVANVSDDVDLAIHFAAAASD